MDEEKLGHSETGHCIVRPHKGPLKFRKEAHTFLNLPSCLGTGKLLSLASMCNILAKFYLVCICYPPMHLLSPGHELLCHRCHNSGNLVYVRWENMPIKHLTQRTQLAQQTNIQCTRASKKSSAIYDAAKNGTN